jgi:uncharacterized caspase-like protein
MRRFGWVAFALVILTLVAAPAQAEKRVALLMANQGYSASVGTLKNPFNDIAVVGDALSKQGFEILPPIKDGKRSAMLGGVRDLVRRLNAAGAGAIGFIYYSGHGAAEKDTNINYLIPVDASAPGTSAFWDDSVKLDDVLRLLDGARSAAKFIVFDACRNELQLPTKDTSKGLVPVGEQQGMFIAYASAPGRTASDMGDKSGPYAAALAVELAHPGLDHLNLFQNIKEAVLTATGGAQQPWESNGLRQRVYLTGEPTTPADMALWSSVNKSDDVPALQRYLERFPNGLYANTARLMITRLTREAAERQQAEAKRKAQEEQHAAELRNALEEARKAREALAEAKQLRNAAAAREEDLRRTQKILQDIKEKSGEQTVTGHGTDAALAQRADAAAEEARSTREALVTAEAKRKEAETRLAALEEARHTAKAGLPGQFDGAWNIRRKGPGCESGQDVLFLIVITDRLVQGLSAGQQRITGTLEISGEIHFRHATIDRSNHLDGRSAVYSGTLRGNAGSGSFNIASTRCNGSFSASREQADSGTAEPDGKKRQRNLENSRGAVGATEQCSNTTWRSRCLRPDGSVCLRKGMSWDCQ